MNNALAQVERLLANLLALGGKRLMALAMIGVAVFGAITFAGYYLSRPSSETLYSGLDRDDVVSIGSSLREAGINFDVSADGAAVTVPVGQAASARMMLAEKGLPHSGSIGNELYDKLGSLGLTSFMQEVTRVRAMEGELARTIQMIRGVKAARVHIVMSDEGSFRREKQSPSASVIVRTDGGDDRSVGDSIRHLVAAAIPNMKTDEVTVLNVDGRLLASGPDNLEKSPDNLLGLEKEVSQELREKITTTLAPYLSLHNFQVSVAARLNADKTQTNETIYNPDQRVERSVRVVKEKQNSQNAAGQPAAGVAANLPANKPQTSDSKQSSDATDKKEELTNYEVSSKQITTTSAGFVIDGLSVAVLINKASLTASLGDKPAPDALSKQVQEIEQLVTTAAGLRKDRGDLVKIAVVDFAADSARDLAPVEPPSLLETLARQAGSFVSSGAIVLVALLLLWFGLRPATRMLLAPPAESASAFAGGLSELPPPMSALDGPGGPGGPAIALGSLGGPEPNFLIDANDERDDFLKELVARKDKSPQRHLQKLVDFDEEVAAAILKQWIREGANA
ncbi:MAG: flagellar basal-body MS-ring/collar protein FliF [Roseiarcus sp.]|jgi:flagellar M-ring protein FliF